MNGENGITIRQVWDLYTASQAAKGVGEITLRNYGMFLHTLSLYIDVERSIDDLSKHDLDSMVVQMRNKGLAARADPKTEGNYQNVMPPNIFEHLLASISVMERLSASLHRFLLYSKRIEIVLCVWL